MKFNRRWLASGTAVVALGAAATGTALAQSDSQPTQTVEAEDDAGEDEDEQVTDADAREQAEAAALEAAGGQGTVTEVELADDGDSGYEVDVDRPDGSSVEVALTDAFEVISVEEDDDEREDEGEDEDVPITGDTLEQVTTAALAHTEGGTVTETEVEDGEEEAFYEVEVTLDNGQEVELELDEKFNVVGEETESEGDDD